MSFRVQSGALTCTYCGYTKEPSPQPPAVADRAEQTADFVLPTTRGHRWAEAQQRTSCGQCGAVTLLPPGQKAALCPYCGSSQIIASAEAIELVDPQVIAPFKLDAVRAEKQVKRWLGKGIFTPDDLALRSGGLKLRAAYYPFWTFDGTLEMPWHCEVNEGTSRAPHWVMRNGEMFEFFDDVLVPGLKSMPNNELSSVEPFDLKDVQEFAPDYVAGFPALGYDLPLADASLRAREKVITKIRRKMYAEVEPGREKRSLDVGAGKWSGLTFKHILLPLWVGTYHFQGKDFKLLVNGQTGKVGGKKPRDNVKVVGVVALILIAVAVLAVILYLLWVRSGGMSLGG